MRRLTTISARPAVGAALALLLGIAAPATADAATLRWTGAAGTDLLAAGSWEGGVAPVDGDALLIPALPVQPVLATGSLAPAEVALEAGAHLGMTGGTLDATALTLAAGATVDQSGGSLVAATAQLATGTLALAGTADAQVGSLRGGAVAWSGGTLALGSGGVVGTRIDVTGDVTLPTSATLGSGASVRVAGATLDLAGMPVVVAGGTLATTDDGTISGGVVTWQSGGLVPAGGHLTLAGGGLIEAGTITCSWTIQLPQGWSPPGFRPPCPVAVAGTRTLAAGSTLELASGMLALGDLRLGDDSTTIVVEGNSSLIASTTGGRIVDGVIEWRTAGLELLDELSGPLAHSSATLRQLRPGLGWLETELVLFDGSVLELAQGADDLMARLGGSGELRVEDGELAITGGAQRVRVTVRTRVGADGLVRVPAGATLSFGNLLNATGDALSGGSYSVAAHARLVIDEGTIDPDTMAFSVKGLDVLDASLELAAASSDVAVLDVDFAPVSVLDGLTDVTAAAELVLGPGAAVGGDRIVAAGTVAIAPGASVTARTAFVQTGGAVGVDGTLAAPAVAVSGGVLGGDGAIAGDVDVLGGALVPGDGLAIGGALRIGPHGALRVPVGVAATGSVVAAGALQLDGTIAATRLDGVPAYGAVRTVLAGAGRSGTFAAPADGLVDLGTPVRARVRYRPTGVDLEITETALPEVLPGPPRPLPPHDAGPSAVAAVAVAWSAAADAGSGVQGYSVAFSSDPGTVPDAIVDTVDPAASAELGDGTWYAHVRAVDAAGNWTEAVHGAAFAIDLDDPDTTIEAGPSGTVARDAAALAFASDEADAAFACSLDGAPFAACASATRLRGLADGAHTLRVRAVDVVGHVDPTPAARSWSVDTAPAAATFTIVPPPLLVGSTATVAFTSEPGATFACAVDAAPAAPCSSPVVLRALAAGRHAFAVRASDAVGNVGAAAVATFVTVTSLAAGPTTGDDRLVGTPGRDAIDALAGADDVRGLAGDDRLRGGPGQDMLIGGAGRDVLVGGPGRDVIRARDGAPGDRVACGPGRDVVLADVGDRVAADCEVVRR